MVNDANNKCWANSGGGELPLTIAFGACAANGADANSRVKNSVPDGHLFTPLLYAAKKAALNSGIRDQSGMCRLCGSMRHCKIDISVFMTADVCLETAAAYGLELVWSQRLLP